MTPLEAELLRRQVAATYGPTAALGNVGDYFFKKGGAGPMQKAIAKDTASLTKMISSSIGFIWTSTMTSRFVFESSNR